MHRSQDARLLLSTAYPGSGAFSVLLDCRLVGVFPFPCQVVRGLVCCHNDLGSAMELASKVRDFPLQGFAVRNGFFAPHPPYLSPHSFSLALSPPVVLWQGPIFSPLPGVVTSVHFFPPVFVARIVTTVLQAHDVSMGPYGPSVARLLLWDPILSWVPVHLLTPIVVVGDSWLSRSPGKLLVQAWLLFCAQMDLTSIVDTVRLAHGGVCHLPSWWARVIQARWGSVRCHGLGVALCGVWVLFVSDDGGRSGVRSVEGDVYPLWAFPGSAGGIVGLRVLHCWSCLPGTRLRRVLVSILST